MRARFVVLGAWIAASIAGCATEPPPAVSRGDTTTGAIGGATVDAGVSREVSPPAHPGWVAAPIGADATRWALFLNGVHKRLHPSITDGYLAELDRLPKGDPRNDRSLITRLELAFDPKGALAILRVRRSSGVPSFDEGILGAIRRAAPFPPPPPELRSPDGNAYVEWEMHRDETYGCSTMNTRPWRFVEESDGGARP